MNLQTNFLMSLVSKNWYDILRWRKSMAMEESKVTKMKTPIIQEKLLHYADIRDLK